MAGPVNEKALKLLGATDDEVRLEYATVVYQRAPSPAGAQRVFVETFVDSAPKSKQHARLGVPNEQPLQWLARRGSSSADMENKVVRSKALKMLGATIDDVRIEKALLVMGEAPGREVPAGAVPRPAHYGAASDPVWAEPPPREGGPSAFLAAFLPWGLLAPLNILKLQLNTTSPLAHLFVPKSSEVCQAACGIARMWATLFWSMQLICAVACVYLHYNRERGLAMLLTSNKLVVGALLLKSYAGGVILAPIGLGGGAVELLFALLFVRELRRR